LKDYWNLLAEKRDAVVQVPLARVELRLGRSEEPKQSKFEHFFDRGTILGVSFRFQPS